MDGTLASIVTEYLVISREFRFLKDGASKDRGSFQPDPLLDGKERKLGKRSRYFGVAYQFAATADLRKVLWIPKSKVGVIDFNSQNTKPHIIATI